jgi:hypothetical protein
MVNGKIVIGIDTAESLANELTRLGRVMISVGKKIGKLTPTSKVRKIKVSRKTDPEMFTKKFVKAVKEARCEIEQGKTIDYFEFRKTLDL